MRLCKSVAHVERIRSFIAIDLGAEIRAALHAVTSELARAGADARWVRPEAMHATLKFLGGVEATRLEAVRDTVDSVAADHDAMRLPARGLGAFPSMQRPRVLWAGLDASGLAVLANSIDSALAPLGFEPEARPFNPHITLARLRSLRGWPTLSTAVAAHADDDFGSVDVKAVTIYRSTLNQRGAVYKPLWTIPLAQHK